MDSASAILLLMLTCTLILSSLHARTKKPNYKLPPGPSLLTMMTNFHEFVKKPQQTMAKLAMIYGPLMHMKLGNSTTIMISSPNMAKEVLQTHDILLADRTVPQVAKSHNHDNFSLPFLPVCPLWRELRKICNNELFANKSLDASQNLRRKTLLVLLGDVHKNSLTGEAVHVGRAAFKNCINFLSNTFVSQDLVHSISKDDKCKDIVGTLLKLTGTVNMVDFFPVLKIFDPQGLERRTSAYISQFFTILDSIIDERVKQREEYVTNNDMLDALLNISQQDSQKMDKEMIKHFLLDLLVAGTDTTAYALERAMTELLHNPEAMLKAKKELEQTIGMGSPVIESDIARLPYLQAVIKETLRLYPPAPLLLPRKARVDVEILGYTIPQGARVLINEWAICRNSSIWDNADSFSPERFLDSEIDVKGQSFQFTPFGGGRRICPGSPLAMRMLHLMLGSLINTFDWKLENNMKPNDMDMDQPLRAIPISVN